MPATERKCRRQIAAETKRVNRQDGTGGRFGVEAGVVGGEIDFAAGKRGPSVAPGYMVKAAGRLAIRIGGGETIKRPPWSGAAVGTSFAHALDLPDLHRRRSAGVGHDAVFGLGMVESNRFATLWEQVYDRRAPERQGVQPDGSLEFE